MPLLAACHCPRRSAAVGMQPACVQQCEPRSRHATGSPCRGRRVASIQLEGASAEARQRSNRFPTPEPFHPLLNRLCIQLRPHCCSSPLIFSSVETVRRRAANPRSCSCLAGEGFKSARFGRVKPLNPSLISHPHEEIQKAHRVRSPCFGPADLTTGGDRKSRGSNPSSFAPLRAALPEAH